MKDKIYNLNEILIKLNSVTIALENTNRELNELKETVRHDHDDLLQTKERITIFSMFQTGISTFLGVAAVAINYLIGRH